MPPTSQTPILLKISFLERPQHVDPASILTGADGVWTLLDPRMLSRYIHKILRGSPQIVSMATNPSTLSIISHSNQRLGEKGCILCRKESKWKVSEFCYRCDTTATNSGPLLVLVPEDNEAYRASA